MSNLQFPTEKMMENAQWQVSGYVLKKTGIFDGFEEQGKIYEPFDLHIDQTNEFFEHVSWSDGKPSRSKIRVADINYKKRKIIINSEAFIQYDEDGAEHVDSNFIAKAALIYAFHKPKTFLFDQKLLNQAGIESSEYIRGVCKYVELKTALGLTSFIPREVKIEMIDRVLEIPTVPLNKLDARNYAFRIMEKIDESVERIESLPQDVAVRVALMAAAKSLDFDKRFKQFEKDLEIDVRSIFTEAGLFMGHYTNPNEAEVIIEGLDRVCKPITVGGRITYEPGGVALEYLDRFSRVIKDGGSIYLTKLFSDRYKNLVKISRDLPLRDSDVASIREIADTAKKDLLPGLKKGSEIKFERIK